MLEMIMMFPGSEHSSISLKTNAHVPMYPQMLLGLADLRSLFTLISPVLQPH